jgi:predicted regulator of Ras-like GTPase activity (Roadblock/LC7/MglB family)
MFEERLQAIAGRLEDARLVALVAQDGIPVETHGDGAQVDVEALAAELVTQVRSIAGNHGELEMGRVRQLAITTDTQILMMGALAGGYYLLVALGAAGSFGRARFELRRAPLAFDQDLE